MYGLTMAAADLKIAAPEQFDKLVEAVRALEARLNQDLIVAGATVIFNAQGQTWLASQLRQRLETCLEQRKNYENRR